MAIKIYRQIYEPTLGDLSSSPVWTYVFDEEREPDQDKATVRPYTFSGTLEPSVGQLIVAAHFRLGDGTKWLGYLNPPSISDRSLGVIQPQIVTDSGQIGFWLGRCSSDTVRAY